MKKTAYKLIVAILIISFGTFFQASPLRAFSIGEEREVGEKLLYSVRSAFPLVDDPDITQYLTDLGREVLGLAGIQYFDYHFFVISDDEFNAFAAPSGLVFFYSGLIATMKSEDEFVSVLAHEIGHVVKRHLASRMEKGMYVSVATLGLAIAAMALGGGGAASQTLFAGSLAAGQSAQLHFSRQDEEEADLLAYGWMKKMHRDPIGQKKMLETMRRITRYRSERLPQYLLTHPETESRLEYVQSLLEINKDKGVAAPPARDNFDFLRFKYRVMAAAKDTTSFRTNLATILADAQSSPTDIVMAKFGLAEIERRENNYRRSRELLDEVIAAYPQKNILQTDKGVLAYVAGDYREARTILEAAVSKDKNNMYATFNLGRTCFALGDTIGAEKYYNTVVQEMTEFAKVYFELGKVAAARNKNGDSSLFLGKYYLYEGKLKLARQSLKLALADSGISAKGKEEGEQLLEVIERLEKK
jgi:beta-barrel assembly-enhancing protease